MPEAKSDTLTITFDPALPGADGAKIAEVSLREPTVVEVLRAEEAREGKTGVPATRAYQEKLLELVGGIKGDALAAIRMSDFHDAARFLTAFAIPGEDAEQPPDPPTPEGLAIELPAEVEAMGHRVSRLELAELTLAQMRKAEAGLAKVTPVTIRVYQIISVALSADLPRPVVEKMPVRIVDRAAAFVQGFSEGGLATGER